MAVYDCFFEWYHRPIEDVTRLHTGYSFMLMGQCMFGSIPSTFPSILK